MALPKISENLQKRVLSAGILAPLVLFVVYSGGALFASLVVFITIIMILEWDGIIISGENEIAPKDRSYWQKVGIFYVGIFSSSLLYLNSLPNSFFVIMYILLTVWATDIAAYFTGKTLKGPKIAPKISPNKTWSGLIGGMLAAAAVGVFYSNFVQNQTILNLAILGAALAVISQIGDFFESWVKRKFGVKDSGTLIPGHGGLLDRIDGFTTVAPILSFIILISGESFLK